MATMTLTGLYNYDNSIFDKIALPDVLDKETVVNAILLNCGEFEPLYPAPDAIKDAIAFWSASKKHSWNKIAFALYREYNPFINFTRNEKRETEYTPNLIDERRPDITNTSSASANTTETPDLKTAHKVAAWNETALQNSEETNYTGTSTNAQTSASTHTETGSETRTQTGSSKTVETFHSEGDSAMYTPTDVAQKEVELRISYDMVDIIIDSFKTNIVLAIY